MSNPEICEYLGITCKHLALRGLSWNYNCYSESRAWDNTPCGEGEIIIYFLGYKFPQQNHGRISFCKEDTGEDKDKIFLLYSWGVQGPGEHYRPDSIINPTELEIANAIDNIAEYLRKVRIPIEY